LGSNLERVDFSFLISGFAEGGEVTGWGCLSGFNLGFDLLPGLLFFSLTSTFSCSADAAIGLLSWSEALAGEMSSWVRFCKTVLAEING
jgi:hypothetical protein